MHLTGIRLGNLPPFTEPITVRFDERVNVFIGPNASGKSMLLLALADHFLRSSKVLENAIPWERLHLSEFPDDEFDEFLQEDPKANVLAASEDWFGARYGNVPTKVMPPIVYIGPVREGLSKKLDRSDAIEFGNEAAEVLDGPFSGARAICAFELSGFELGELGDELRENGEASPYLKKTVLRDAEALAATCCQQICREILQEPRLNSYIRDPRALDRLHDPLGDLSALNDLRSLGIRTTDKPNFDNYSHFEQPARGMYGNSEETVPIPVSHLSSGTGGSLLWIMWLALKMAHHYDFDAGSQRDPDKWSEFKDSWDKKPAILLIDEIENHLHPTWQRRVIPALLEHFPGLQIFATTHSPFVVAGLKAGQVHVLKRDENGVVTASTEQRDVVGWTMDEILRGMMGVDDPTDEDTARAAAELRQLRNEGPRVDEKAEEQRQKRIQELRQKVDRDLLAGGPLAAQRELFERNLAEILEEHRKAQGLNQD